MCCDFIIFTDFIVNFYIFFILKHSKEVVDSPDSHLMDVNEHYDAVSDALLFDNDTRHVHEKPSLANTRPNSRNRISNIYLLLLFHLAFVAF